MACTKRHEGCDLTVGASLKVGSRVAIRMYGCDDTFPAEHAGRSGVIAELVIGDHGACEHLPAYVVRFDDGTQDMFWLEELS